MRVSSDFEQWRVTIHLDNDAAEACYVYDLMQSGRLQVPNSELLPLPFRGQFLFKVPGHPRPLTIQVGRFEATPVEVLEGKTRLSLAVTCPRGTKELLAELEAALRDVPPAAEEELKYDASSREDEQARIRKMTFAQRVIYATRAGSSGRQMIMLQPSPILLLYLCKNPLITLPEVIQIAKMPSIDALVTEYLVKLLRSNPVWAMSEELKFALVTNTKTPGGTALSLLRHLSARSLRKVAKCDVGSALKNAVLRLLMERRE